jgi:hypothetical protein
MGFLLCHCGLGLKLQAVAAALELCPRALSTLRKWLCREDGCRLMSRLDLPP